MKKGKVIALTLSHKNGNKVLRAGDPVTENDIVDFDIAVKQGFIEPSDTTKKAQKAAEKKAADEKKAEEAKKLEAAEKKAIEAAKLAKEK